MLGASKPHAPRDYRPGRQVRQAARRLPLRCGGAAPRGDMRAPRTWTSTGSTANPSRRRAWPGVSPAATASSAGGLWRPRHRGNDCGRGLLPGAQCPYFGICLGMQIAVIELPATLRGFQTPIPANLCRKCRIRSSALCRIKMRKIAKGGTMRLGAYPCHVLKGTRMYECYGRERIGERHRHRYECNNDYRELLTERGLPSAACRRTTASSRPWNSGERLLRRRAVSS